MCLLVALCECAFVYQCVGVVYPCGVRGYPCINYMSPLKSISTSCMPPRQDSEIRVGAHARKRHVSTIRDVGGSRVSVYVVPGRCDVRSSDP